MHENRLLVIIIGPLYIWFHRHRSDLTVKEIIKEYKEVIPNVTKIMKEVQFNILTALLRRKRSFRAKERVETWFSYTADIIFWCRMVQVLLTKVCLADVYFILIEDE